MTPTIEELARGLTEAHLDIMDRLYRGLPLPLASRQQDKLRRTLRQRGLIAYCGKPVRWQITPLGLTLRAYLEKTHG